MTGISRRKLARYAADKLSQGAPVKTIVREIAAELLDSKRKNEVDLVVADIAYELFQNRTQVSASVVTTIPLTEAQRDHIKSALCNRASINRVYLSESVDQKIGDGIIIDTPLERIDSSTESALLKLKRTIS